ncbi:D-alanyl-D-alanine carboxypeptidase family protein [Nocardiopsis sp. NPDC006938]|uniref:D-alanyl-D-alanine carboxypeptidase family protein n=1 Tax=Nocardiopsis sp. NPDC006938 TaxID=3364337 RepID=UPI00368ECB94
MELATARAEVASLRESAQERISAYEEESARLDELTGRRESAESRADAAERRHEGTRLGAARQAAGAYKGVDLSLMRAWIDPEGPTRALERGSYLTLFGEHRSADLARARASRVASDTLAETARTAEREQAEATEAAEDAREAAEAAITAQEERSERLLDQQTRLEKAMAAAPATGKEARTAGPPEREAPEGCAEKGGSADVENGRVPQTLLCPLPQAGERLRADAATAFVALDRDFRSEFGRPMCVTDSYRPYHEQVRLFQEMLPGMAARPGTSAHGLGLAVDLCGGVNELDAPEHRWMLDHAPEHGWHNPEWARDGFEPWHWEFTP